MSNSKNLKLYGLFEISGEILVKTGLHIGGGKEGYEIGELDNPVIRLVEMKGSEIKKIIPGSGLKDDETYSIPYIPGSSLKGKMRSMLEWAYGLVGEYLSDPDREKSANENEGNTVSIVDLVKYEQKIEHPIAMVFGLSAAEAKETPSQEESKETEGEATTSSENGQPEQAGNGNSGNNSETDGNTENESNKKKGQWHPGPTRLYVFDAYPTPQALGQFLEGTDSEFTEIKWENTIDRLTSAANPRQMERVPAGFTFSFKMRYFVYGDKDFEKWPLNDNADGRSQFYPVELVFQGMKLVEESGLGGSVTRGYGDVQFEIEAIKWLDITDILNARPGQNLGELDVEKLQLGTLGENEIIKLKEFLNGVKTKLFPSAEGEDDDPSGGTDPEGQV